MPAEVPQSKFYSERPIFSSSSSVTRPSRLEGNRGLLVFTVTILVVAALSGFLYMRRNSFPAVQTQSAPRSVR